MLRIPKKTQIAPSLSLRLSPPRSIKLKPKRLPRKSPKLNPQRKKRPLLSRKSQPNRLRPITEPLRRLPLLRRKPLNLHPPKKNQRKRLSPRKLWKQNLPFKRLSPPLRKPSFLRRRSLRFPHLQKNLQKKSNLRRKLLWKENLPFRRQFPLLRRLWLPRRKLFNNNLTNSPQKRSSLLLRPKHKRPLLLKKLLLPWRHKSSRSRKLFKPNLQKNLRRNLRLLPRKLSRQNHLSRKLWLLKQNLLLPSPLLNLKQSNNPKNLKKNLKNQSRNLLRKQPKLNQSRSRNQRKKKSPRKSRPLSRSLWLMKLTKKENSRSVSRDCPSRPTKTILNSFSSHSEISSTSSFSTDLTENQKVSLSSSSAKSQPSTKPWSSTDPNSSADPSMSSKLKEPRTMPTVEVSTREETTEAALTKVARTDSKIKAMLRSPPTLSSSVVCPTTPLLKVFKTTSEKLAMSRELESWLTVKLAR